MEKDKKLTMRSIARMCNVSVGTVSLALNNKPGVNAATRQKINDIIKTTGYNPFKNNPQLKKIQQFQIRVVLPMNMDLTATIPYFSIALAGVKSACQEAGYDMLVSSEDEWLNAEQRGNGNYGENVQLVSGVIFISPHKYQAEGLTKAAAWGIPAALINRTTDMKNVIVVREKKAEAIQAAVAHLRKLGIKSAGYFDNTELFYGLSPVFITACRSEGLANEEHQNTWTTVEHVEDWLQTLHQRRLIPGAFLAFDDLLAVGTIKALQKLGYRVPQDVAVVGYNNSVIARCATPELTSVHSPVYDMCRFAVEQLVKRLNGDTRPVSEALFEAPIVFRESCPAC